VGAGGHEFPDGSSACNPVASKGNGDPCSEAGFTGVNYGICQRNQSGEEPQQSISDRYINGWKYFGNSLSVLKNPNATLPEKYFSAEYAFLWGESHLLLGTGVAGLGCAVLVAGCAAAVEATIGTSPIWIQQISKGGAGWHIGLETVYNDNIVHIGNHTDFGVHIAFGSVMPFVADLHVYPQWAFPFYRLFRPGMEP
jgi:hypothetical protein